MKILVITSCTGEKLHHHSEQLTLEDFKKDSAHIQKRESALKDYLTPAQDLYTGQQHIRLIRGLDEVLAHDPEVEIDLWIVSAGYGIIPGSQNIVPYECTFQGMKKSDINSFAEHLSIPERFQKLILGNYDLGIMMLGESYLAACKLNSKTTLNFPMVMLGSKKTASQVSKISNLFPVALTNEDTRRFHAGLVALKGEIGARILKKLATKELTISELTTGTEYLDKLVDEENSTSKSRLSAVDYIIKPSEAWKAQAKPGGFKFYIPEWDDLVDPDYDFKTDTHSGGRGSWETEVYSHQMYGDPNYDGILISKVVAEKSKAKKQRINEMGVHRYLRVPQNYEIMGDCGAFGYIKEDVPPYETDEILDYYTRLGFNYGVSIDHLIVPKFIDQKEKRYDITLTNAEAFIKEHKSRGLSWTPIGAVQGWDPESYAKAAKLQAKMGYDYLALGGMVRSTTSEIRETLKAVRLAIPTDTKLHLFGVVRLDFVKEAIRLGLYSADTASPLRRAWLSSRDNYWAPDGSKYAAIRIPETGKSFRTKQAITRGDVTFNQLQTMERAALLAMKEYSQRKLDLESTLNAIMEFDSHVTEDRNDLSEQYRRTLEDRPWEKCSCNICRDAGYHVTIFRGNNRNRRRGFHNTHIFYKYLKEILFNDLDYAKLMETIKNKGKEQTTLFNLE